MEKLKDLIYRSDLKLRGFEYPKPGHFTCPNCGKMYKPKYPMKEKAFETDDKEAREQWLSHICSTKCWKEYLGVEEE